MNIVYTSFRGYITLNGVRYLYTIYPEFIELFNGEELLLFDR